MGRDGEVLLAGDVSFTDSEDVETFLDGGSNDAGFVQIMRGSADRDQLHALDAGFEEVAGDWRPDIIGGVRVWTGPDRYTEANYFTSEAEAREGEKKEPPSRARGAGGRLREADGQRRVQRPPGPLAVLTVG